MMSRGKNLSRGQVGWLKGSLTVTWEGTGHVSSVVNAGLKRNQPNPSSLTLTVPSPEVVFN